MAKKFNSLRFRTLVSVSFLMTAVFSKRLPVIPCNVQHDRPRTSWSIFISVVRNFRANSPSLIPYDVAMETREEVGKAGRRCIYSPRYLKVKH